MCYLLGFGSLVSGERGENQDINSLEKQKCHHCYSHAVGETVTWPQPDGTVLLGNVVPIPHYERKNRFC